MRLWLILLVLLCCVQFRQGCITFMDVGLLEFSGKSVWNLFFFHFFKVNNERLDLSVCLSSGALPGGGVCRDSPYHGHGTSEPHVLPAGSQ